MEGLEKAEPIKTGCSEPTT